MRLTSSSGGTAKMRLFQKDKEHAKRTIAFIERNVISLDQSIVEEFVGN